MSLAARALHGVVSLYRHFVSPWFPRRCRYEPTCSAYALEALATHGALRGLGLALARIARCHPWRPGGVDPVPARRA